MAKDFLFSPNCLAKLTKWNEISGQLGANGLYARPLELGDYDHGYLELLSQLTTVGQISREQFETRFREMQAVNNVRDHYAPVVIVDNSSEKIVGTSTFILEHKFIHECANRGRLEDVAVLDTHRGKRIGELVVKIIVELAREYFKCYKLSLDCTDELMKFYAKNNFTYGSNMLTIRFSS